MTAHNAARTLPPGDRDDAPPVPSSTPDGSPKKQDGAPAVPGRKPFEERLAALAAILDESQYALGEIRMALSRGDEPTALAAARRLREALMADPRIIAAEAFRDLAQGRRKAMHEELSQ